MLSLRQVRGSRSPFCQHHGKYRAGSSCRPRGNQVLPHSTHLPGWVGLGLCTGRMTNQNLPTPASSGSNSLGGVFAHSFSSHVRSRANFHKYPRNLASGTFAENIGCSLADEVCHLSVSLLTIASVQARVSTSEPSYCAKKNSTWFSVVFLALEFPAQGKIGELAIFTLPYSPGAGLSIFLPSNALHAPSPLRPERLLLPSMAAHPEEV